MRSNTHLLSLAFALALASCGSSDAASQDQGASSVADLCAGAVQSSNGVATTVGCAFENQLNNIYNHGAASPPVALYDTNGRQLGSASRSCDVWWEATDADGITILLNRDTGEIRAHGMVHPSMPTTTLPRYVSVPIVTH